MVVQEREAQQHYFGKTHKGHSNTKPLRRTGCEWERRKYGALRQAKQEDQQSTAEPQGRCREFAGERVSRDVLGRERLEFISFIQGAQLDPSRQMRFAKSEPRDCRVGSGVGRLVGRGVRSKRNLFLKRGGRRPWSRIPYEGGDREIRGPCRWRGSVGEPPVV